MILSYAFIIYILLTPMSCWELGSSHAGCYTNTEVITVIDYFKFKYKFIDKRLSDTTQDNDKYRDLNTQTQIFIVTVVKTPLIKWGTEFAWAPRNICLH